MWEKGGLKSKVGSPSSIQTGIVPKAAVSVPEKPPLPFKRKEYQRGTRMYTSSLDLIHTMMGWWCCFERLVLVFFYVSTNLFMGGRRLGSTLPHEEPEN